MEATDLVFTDSSDRLSPSGPNCHSLLRDAVRILATSRDITAERRGEDRLKQALPQRSVRQRSRRPRWPSMGI